MELKDIGYGMSLEVPLGYDRAVERAREELAKEGF
jgi:Ni,Fe-hydrogenase maturation factor